MPRVNVNNTRVVFRKALTGDEGGDFDVEEGDADYRIAGPYSRSCTEDRECCSIWMIGNTRYALCTEDGRYLSGFFRNEDELWQRPISEKALLKAIRGGAI